MTRVIVPICTDCQGEHAECYRPGLAGFLMKSVLLLLILVMSFFALLAPAQNSGAMPPGHQMLASPDAFADGHLAVLDKQVGLSAEQKPQLRAVFLQEGRTIHPVWRHDIVRCGEAGAHSADPHRYRA